MYQIIYFRYQLDKRYQSNQNTVSYIFLILKSLIKKIWTCHNSLIFFGFFFHNTKVYDTNKQLPNLFENPFLKLGKKFLILFGYKFDFLWYKNHLNFIKLIYSYGIKHKYVTSHCLLALCSLIPQKNNIFACWYHKIM